VITRPAMTLPVVGEPDGNIARVQPGEWSKKWERRLEAISAKGDPLDTIKKMVRWEDCRADIEAGTETKPEERKSNARRKPYDTILKFKIVVLLQSLHNLSANTSPGPIRTAILRRIIGAALSIVALAANRARNSRSSWPLACRSS
jgi:hypothetical protein